MTKTFATVRDLANHIESLMGANGSRAAAVTMADIAWRAGVRDEDALDALWPTDDAFSAAWDLAVA